LEEEVEFLLTHAAHYLTKDPGPKDVLSVFAGLRPLVSQGAGGDTAAVSRDHTVHISRNGLVTIAGGKWTTCRKMAEDTIDQAATVAQLKESPSVSANLNIHGYHRNSNKFGDLALYGADARSIMDIKDERPEYAEKLHDRFTTVGAEVIWAVRREMARTVEDFLARRTRALFLDARASMDMAPKVASLMAETLGRDEAWASNQIHQYRYLAEGYLLK
jgi:glycerol-3-phosphate dehydrogenase